MGTNRTLSCLVEIPGGYNSNPVSAGLESGGERGGLGVVLSERAMAAVGEAAGVKRHQVVPTFNPSFGLPGCSHPHFLFSAVTVEISGTTETTAGSQIRSRLIL